MSMSVKQLKELRAPHAETIQKLADKINVEKRDFTPTEKVEWDQANTEFNRLTAEIRAASVGREMGRRTYTGSDTPGLEDSRFTDPEERMALAHQATAESLQGWMRASFNMPLKERHVRAMRACGVRPSRTSMHLRIPRRPLVESRALSVGINAAGGYTVPQGFVPSLERALKQYAQVRSVADVLRTATGNPLPWPTTNDTGNVGELLAENTAAAEQDVVFGQAVFNAFKFSSKLVRVSSELLNDSAIDLANELGGLLGERIGRAQAAYLTTGTGVGQPQGVLTGAVLGKTAASATAFTPDELLDLIHSVDPAYRSDPSFALMMSDTVLSFVRKMKDAQGRYFFNGSPGGGDSGDGAFKGSIFGVPVVVNQQLPTAFTTGQKLVLCGAFSKYKIRDVNSIRLVRSDERYMEMDQVAFVAFLRTDAKLLDAGTNPIKYLALA